MIITWLIIKVLIYQKVIISRSFSTKYKIARIRYVRSNPFLLSGSFTTDPFLETLVWERRAGGIIACPLVCPHGAGQTKTV